MEGSGHDRRGDRLVATISPGTCVGSMTCISIAGDLFDLGEEGHAEFLPADGTHDAAVIEAAQSCPAGAITVRSAATGRQLFP